MFGRLRKRRDFLRVAHSPLRSVRKPVIVQITERQVFVPKRPLAPTPEITESPHRVGLTVSRKIGGAVARNRIKRRLREALRKITMPDGPQDFDMVVVARAMVHNFSVGDLTRELQKAFLDLSTMAQSSPPKERSSLSGQ